MKPMKPMKVKIFTSAGGYVTIQTVTPFIGEHFEIIMRKALQQAIDCGHIVEARQYITLICHKMDDSHSVALFTVSKPPEPKLIIED